MDRGVLARVFGRDVYSGRAHFPVVLSVDYEVSGLEVRIVDTKHPAEGGQIRLSGQAAQKFT